MAELARFANSQSPLDSEVRMTNACPAFARDVDVSTVEWNNETAFGEKIDRDATTLLRGNRGR